MKFDKEVEFPASLEETFALFRDEEFRKEVAHASGAVSCDVSLSEGSNGGFDITMDSQTKADVIPAAARKVLGEEIQIIQEESWSSPSSATLKITIPGKPGEVDGTITLSETDDPNVTVQRVEAEITVRIPVLGKKLEKVIAGIVSDIVKLQAKMAAER